MSRGGNNEYIKKEGRPIPESYAQEVSYLVLNQAEILFNAMKSRLATAQVNYRPEETKAYYTKLVTEIQSNIVQGLKHILESL